MNEKISLYFSEGSSDKEYHAQLESQGDGFVVNFQYGRRGASLTAGTKTASPVPFDKAKKVYDKLVAEKMGKGYSTGEAGVAYQGGSAEEKFTGILPQLLNAIDEPTALSLLDDDRYVMQEKYDGRRRLSQKTAEGVIGINKKGLQVALPVPVAESLATFPVQSIADAEQIGDTLYLFDLLQEGDKALAELGFLARHARLQALAAGLTGLQVTPVYVTSAEKRAAFAAIKAASGEGVVFKLKDAPYKPGRPSSGGSQLKYKFTESATVVVRSVSASKRSVGVGGFDDNNQEVKLGNVTIPPNYAVPAVGAIVEVLYLYAYEGGSLYQPVYRGVRDDQVLADCTTRQLKYKPKMADDEVESDDDN